MKVVQVQKNVQTVKIGNPFQFRTDKADRLPSLFSMQVTQRGGTTATFSVSLEISLDEVNWSTWINYSETQNGTVTFISTRVPAVAFRYNVTALNLGDSTGIDVAICATS